MEWFRAHPYATALAAAFVLITIGAFIVTKRAAVEPTDSAIRVWGGIGAQFFDTTSSAPNPSGNTQENIYSQVRSGPPFYYSSAPAQAPQADPDDFDVATFLAMLSGSGSVSGGTTDASSLDAYSFIPGGLISTSTSQKSRTPAEQALYTYGNEAGSFIQSFENFFRNSSQILKDQLEDRESAQKNAALLSLADSLSGVGRALESIEDVPSEIRATHARVAASYKEMGEKLALIPKARRDEEFVAAIQVYNGAVGSYLKNYVALATLFSAYGVVFSAADPGSVFTFTVQ